MVEVVSVKFKSRGKTYFFDPRGINVTAGERVVVETSKGLELCECVQGPHTVTDERIVPPLRPVVRIATADDLRIAELCKEREKEAFAICKRKIAEHGLEMKLVDCECTFDGGKILFFFTADGRVDFRALVKDLAGEFRTRIELRQIGVRDEAKMLGGVGMCGRPYCCAQFLDDFAPVSTKMAKTQSLSLNPTKISGCCGRLMCCLRYEQKAYEDLVRTVPKSGAFVETADGYGSVAQVNLLRQTVKVKLDEANEEFHTYPADEVAAVPGGRPKNGEAPPHVLELKPKPKEAPEEPEEDEWAAPPIFAEDTAEIRDQIPKRETTEEGKFPRQRPRGRGSRPQQKPRRAQPQQPKEAGPAAEPAQKKRQNAAPRSRNQNRSQNQDQNQRSAAPKEQKQEKKPQAGEKSASVPRRRHSRPKSKGGEAAAPQS